VYKDGMRRSAIRAALTAAALLFAGACGAPSTPTPDESADTAWKLYLAKPDPGTYENFIRANRFAAHQHDMPHDAAGVGYQVRALEVMAAEAERAADATLADDVVRRVDDISQHELTGVYDEVLPGAKDRLAAAKARAARLIR
jgi:ABC-type glycerol-3-phosphate transport system substrate-binding protein